jgi:response regulator of citrate/malate metabolism
MAEGLDVIILDDDEQMCMLLHEMISGFYELGEVHAFTSLLDARTFCFNRGNGLGIFVLDVFLGEHNAFDFLDAISVHYPMAPEDAIIITGAASDDVVDMCMATGVNYLLEKPIRRYALQFAVRAIAGKYQKFALKLMRDPDFAQDVESIRQMAM